MLAALPWRLAQVWLVTGSHCRGRGQADGTTRCTAHAGQRIALEQAALPPPRPPLQPFGSSSSFPARQGQGCCQHPRHSPAAASLKSSRLCWHLLQQGAAWGFVVQV